MFTPWWRNSEDLSDVERIVVGGFILSPAWSIEKCGPVVADRRSRVTVNQFATSVDSQPDPMPFGHRIIPRLITSHGHEVLSRCAVTGEDNCHFYEGSRQGNRLQRGRLISSIRASIGQIQSSGNDRNVRRLLNLGRSATGFPYDRSNKQHTTGNDGSERHSASIGGLLIAKS